MTHFTVWIDLSKGSIESYFHEKLNRSDVGLTDGASSYVIGVLVRFSKSSEYLAGVGQGEKVTLFDFLDRAQTVSKPERQRIYQHIGDVSLFTISLFPDSIPVSRSYYVSVGGGSYQTAASLSKRVESSILEEVGTRFDEISHTLTSAVT